MPLHLLDGFRQLATGGCSAAPRGGGGPVRRSGTAMTSADRIRRRGFRKWYERELLASHANLVLLLLAAVGLLASAELYSARAPLDDQLQAIVTALASAAVGVWALRRYLYLLNHAEFVASQAVCPACDTYARWDPVEPRGDPPLRVRCRRCAHEWHIEL